MSILTEGNRFIDEKGRHIILNGINLVCKDKSLEYLGGYDENLFKQFSEWGFNIIRLGIIWDGVEPEPLKYNDRYLNEIRKYMDMCHKYGIYVVLDMHQDLFSVEYSDGAPKWATLTEGKEHVEGEIWSDAYLLSPAVQTSFDNFWKNTKVKDGIGLQDHFGLAWEHVIKILGEHPALIGCDFINEPFPGSKALDIYGAMFYSFGQVLGKVTGKDIGLEQAAQIFNDTEKMAEALIMMNNYELYSAAAEPVGQFIKQFDKQILNGFYNKLTERVRLAGYQGIIMQENNYFSNAGVPSSVELIKTDGKIDMAQAYSPHGYDLVVDTKGVGALSSNSRVDVIFDNHEAVQKRLNVPVIVGEWGAFSHYKDTLPHCSYIIKIFEKYLWSNTYWCFHENFDAVPVLSLLKRGYPKAVTGKLLEYSYDFEDKKLHVIWDEGDNKEGFSEFYLPHKIENSDFSKENRNNSCIIKVEATGGVRELVL